MKTLLQFFLRYSILLLFLALETVAFILLLKYNNFQHSAILTSANRVSASIYKVNNTVVSYFNLRNENTVLMEENANLKNRIAELENITEKQIEDSVCGYVYSNIDVTYFPAKIINATTDMQRNYITINKGLRDGIGQDMGVMSKDGVVGIVSAVSDKYAVVIPILNPALSISCKFKKNGYVGALNWDGKDYRYAQLLDVARHISVAEGDTIITSGFSEVFQEGVPVGVVDKVELTESDAYYKIRIKLSVDFKNLQYVTVMKYNNVKEKKSIEEQAMK